MKNYLRIVAIVLLFTMTVPLFASCGLLGAVTDAVKLQKLLTESEKYYADRQRAESKTTVTMTGTVSGVNITSSGEITQTITSINIGNDSFEYLDESSNISKTKIADGEETVEEYSTIFGFVDQNIIQAYIPAAKSDGSRKTYLKSPCSVEDFREFLNWRETEMYPNLSEYSVGDGLSVEKNKASNVWEVKMSGVNEESKKVLEDFVNSSLNATALKCSITDFSLAMTINIDTSAVETEKLDLKAVYTMENVDYNLSISSEVKYSLPGADTDLTPENFGDYTETGDLRYIDYAIHSINELNEFSKNISFGFTTSTMLTESSTTGSSSKISRYTETDTVNLGIKDDTFVYHIEANATASGSASYDMIFSYDGKQQSVAVGDQYPQKTLQTEDEAKTYISSAMFYVFDMSRDEVSKVEITDRAEGIKVVRFTLTDENRVKEMFESIGIPISLNLSSSSIRMDFTFDANRNLMRVTYSVDGQYSRYKISHTSGLSNIKDADLSMITVIK